MRVVEGVFTAEWTRDRAVLAQAEALYASRNNAKMG
jgi:hypothetical protein